MAHAGRKFDRHYATIKGIPFRDENHGVPLELDPATFEFMDQ